MITGVIVTNGGPHSAEDWAMASANMLCQAIKISPDSPNKGRLDLAKSKAEIAIAEVLIKHHDAVQKREKARLASGGDKDAPADHRLDVESVVDEVVAAMQPLFDAADSKALVPGFLGHGVPADLEFMEHMRRGIRERIEMDAGTIIGIERDYHVAA